MPREYDYIAKAVLIGDGATGKTSITEKFCHGFFSDSYLMTVGANFYIETIQIKDARVKVQIWDLAGQKHFSFVRSQFYQGAMICIAVFDVTRYSTLISLESWFKEMYKKLDDSPIATILVANKIDLEKERLIDYPEVERFIEHLYDRFPRYNDSGILYVEASAKTGENVEKAFRMVTELFLKKYDEDDEDGDDDDDDYDI